MYGEEQRKLYRDIPEVDEVGMVPGHKYKSRLSSLLAPCKLKRRTIWRAVDKARTIRNFIRKNG